MDGIGAWAMASLRATNRSQTGMDQVSGPQGFLVMGRARGLVVMVGDMEKHLWAS